MILQRVPILPSLPITFQDDSIFSIWSLVAIGQIVPSKKLTGVSNTQEAAIEA